MNKQEQIEEMVGVMAASNNPFVDVPIEIMPQVAEALYNAGYQKIPEDSVVLSREEWKQIKNSLYYSKEELEKKLQRERKETAKEILKLIKGIKHIGSLRSELDMIAIEYGVEVEE